MLSSRQEKCSSENYSLCALGTYRVRYQKIRATRCGQSCDLGEQKAGTGEGKLGRASEEAQELAMPAKRRGRVRYLRQTS